MTKDRELPKQPAARRAASSTATRPAPVAAPSDRNRQSRRKRQRRSMNWQQFRANARSSLKTKTFALITDWRFFTLVGLSLTGGLTAFSIAFLFKLPVLPNCPSVFWPLASGSMRLHCAQLAAGKETVNDLLEAIQLMNTLKPNHPLYAEASRLIEQWSTEILDLTEKEFQAGKIKQAIAGVRKIPANSAAAKLVDEKVKAWEKIWADAEKLYNKVGELLKKSQVADAQLTAAKLLSIDNQYWQTTKYQELSTLIVSTREDMTKIGKAERALESGVVDDIVGGIQDISGIGEKSFVRKEAQDLLPKMGRKLLELAQNALERKDYNAAIDIVNRIPGNVNLGNEIDDFRTIATAESKAWAGGVLNLEEAIAQAQRINKGRPLYDKAQRLIGRWQVEAQEVAQLDQAKRLAQAGDLQNAIAQASQVSGSNQAARDFIQQTTGQIQETQDRPILDQAMQIAMAGDESSLEGAIAQAKQIAPGRSLHAQAKEKIRQWSDQLKQIRNQSAEMARRDAAPSFSPDNAATPSPVVVESTQQPAEQAMLEQARNVAGAGTPDGLLQAIGIAQSLPNGSSMRGEAVASIDQWSNQLVQVAQYQAEFDIPGAIDIASRVPPSSSAYPQAQDLLQKWRKSIGQ